MKKLITIAVIAASALPLAACGAPKAKIPVAPAERNRIASETETPQAPETGHIEIDIDGIQMPLRPGVRRRFGAHYDGSYTVEYVHFGSLRDDTLDYRLDLRPDNTFDLTVTADGVTAAHYGHYYELLSGNIVMYYDEQKEPPAHNVYVSDSLYAEKLPYGKIMIYENGNVIVLNKA